jgi:hypothetical protein
VSVLFINGRQKCVCYADDAQYLPNTDRTGFPIVAAVGCRQRIGNTRMEKIHAPCVAIQRVHLAMHAPHKRGEEKGEGGH